jgi:sugar lactone lactonase YvrE
MLKTLIVLLGLPAAIAATQTPVPASPPPTAPMASPLWTVTEGMDSPESAYFDPVSGFVFVSQIGGQAADRDGNGRISKLTVTGQLIAANWVKGLNAPKGLRSHQGTLYAADLDEIVAVEIASGAITSRIKIDGAQFLNDLTTAPDGAIYASDSFANRIYVVRNGKPSIFFEGDDILLPNGVLVDGKRLIVASDGRPARGGGGTPARLVAIDLITRQLTQINTGPIGTPDGVEHDGRGGFIVSDVGGGRILQVTPGGEVRVLRQVDRQPADICFIPEKGLLLVPHLGLNRVSAYELTELKK